MHAKRSSTLRLTAAAALSLALALAGCKSAPPSDDALNTAVHQRITGDSALASEQIQATVQNGIVTLNGTVSNAAARALAANDAAQVNGVRSVVNNLTVQTAQTEQPPIQTTPQPEANIVPPTPMPHREKKKPQQKPKKVAHPEPPPPPPQPEPLPAPIERRPPPAPVEPAKPLPPPPPAFRNITVPSGTVLPVRLNQTLDSESAQPGDTFTGSISNDILVDGQVVIPAGATVTGHVDAAQNAAHFKGSSLLTISLTGLNRRGERIRITTEPYSREGKGRGKNTAEKIGGGAAIGAILGGIFGGGKGAAIGAAAGGGAGTAANGITRGEQVQIPAETLVHFHLTSAINIRIPNNGSSVPVDNGGLQHRDSQP